MNYNTKNKTCFSVVTLNCKGINNVTKFQKIINIFKAYHADIICLQETNLKISHNNYIIKNWQYFKIFNYYTAILINNPKIIIKKTSTLFNGRSLKIDFEFNNIDFRLYNIYSPPDRQSRIKFWNSFYSIQKSNATNIILGDLNCILYPDRDRISTSNYQKDPTVKLILEKLKNYTDTYSIFNLTLQFTFEMQSHQYKSKLDYIFTDNTITFNFNLKTLYAFSDHLALHVNFIHKIASKSNTI